MIRTQLAVNGKEILPHVRILNTDKPLFDALSEGALLVSDMPRALAPATSVILDIASVRTSVQVFVNALDYFFERVDNHFPRLLAWQIRNRRKGILDTGILGRQYLCLRR